jgi:hypothetical protein
MLQGISVSSNVLCYQILRLYEGEKYIPLPNYNFDDVVMSRGNRNFHLRIFVKGGALQNASFLRTTVM